MPLNLSQKKSSPKELKANKVILNQEESAQVFEKLHSMWPNAHCELVHHTPFQLLVAVVLSAQTTDVAVNKAFGSFISKNPHFGPNEMLKLGEQGFLDIIRTIGLAPTKARNCIKLAAKLIEKFDGQVPRKREELQSLAGVGRKTANVVLNVLYGEPTMAVDTHVARVAVRLGLAAPSLNREHIEAELLKKVPAQFAQNAHHTLIFHGRYHCTARSPRCEVCMLSKWCRKIGINTAPKTTVKISIKH